jgi:hypothetical protein
MNDLYLRMIMAVKAVTRIFARGGGQLNRDTFLGEKIYQLSRIKDFRNFVEIGTWNGQGSTKCFMDALLFRRDASCLYSLESSKAFHEIAKQYWRPVFSTARGKEGLRLIYGRIIEVSELLPSSEIPIDNIEESENYRQWREEDILNYTQSPNVIDMLPRQIDVLMLDGGEFSTYAEFQKLRKRSGVVLLDDTKLLKCKRIREELLHDGEWQVVYDLPEERAGNFVACRWDYYDYIKNRI